MENFVDLNQLLATLLVNAFGLGYLAIFFAAAHVGSGVTKKMIAAKRYQYRNLTGFACGVGVFFLLSISLAGVEDFVEGTVGYTTNDNCFVDYDGRGSSAVYCMD